MRNFTFACLSSLLFTITSFGQQAVKTWFDKTDSVYGYYTAIQPAAPRVQGALVLFDGYGGNADGFFAETKIPNVAYANEMLTVCIPTGMRLYPDKPYIAQINAILSGIAGKYQLRKDQFAIGGMSSGGTIALRYAELCHEKPADYPILPKAVFDVDSPTDLEELYKSSERELKKDYKGWWLGESKMITDRFDKELGDIHGDLKKYREVSPFAGAMTEPGNEQWLKETAVRTYHDVDVNWFIQNRRRSLYETNMLSASELINRLVLAGNDKAEFVSSKIVGRRSNGQRHPHSWNIVDEIDLIQWIAETLHFYPQHIEKPYALKAPQGWQPELIVFPMNFAPSLPYKGFEELRFAPGWGKDGNEKWAYTILWWLDGRYEFNEQILQQNLEAYFTGLTHQQAVAEKQDLGAFAPAKAQVQKIKTMKGDAATYTATAAIFDAYVTRKPGTLYFKIHIKDIAGKGRTIVFLEAAGIAPGSAVWQQLDKISEDTLYE